jgi:co-chaperonin GroES (HSP10)
MAKDSLARGASSAQFMGGTPSTSDPIEFHGTVAVEQEDCDHGISKTRTCILCDAAKLPVVVKPEPNSLEQLAALYEPMNDRVLLRRVTEDNKRLVAMPDAYKLDSDLGVVIAVGGGMLVNGQFVPIPLQLGDKVRVGHYNVEDIEVEGETLMLVSAYDVRLKIKA